MSWPQRVGQLISLKWKARPIPTQPCIIPVCARSLNKSQDPYLNSYVSYRYTPGPRGSSWIKNLWTNLQRMMLYKFEHFWPSVLGMPWPRGIQPVGLWSKIIGRTHTNATMYRMAMVLILVAQYNWFTISYDSFIFTVSVWPKSEQEEKSCNDSKLMT